MIDFALSWKVANKAVLTFARLQNTVCVSESGILIRNHMQMYMYMYIYLDRQYTLVYVKGLFPCTSG